MHCFILISFNNLNYFVVTNYYYAPFITENDNSYVGDVLAMAPCAQRKALLETIMTELCNCELSFLILVTNISAGNIYM